MRSLVICLVLLVGGDDLGRAIDEYRAGRFEEALALFEATIRREGDDAPPELLYDYALAALGAGRFRDAEIAMEKAAARGGEAFDELREFVFGNVAFAQCLSAAELAGRVEAGPVAFDAAILHATRAADHWQRASLARGDWPEARRNAERALRKKSELEEAKAEAARKRRDRPKPKPPRNEPKDPEQPRRRPEERPELRMAKAALKELAPEQVRQLFDKLVEKERAKARMRRRARREGRGAVERDW